MTAAEWLELWGDGLLCLTCDRYRRTFDDGRVYCDGVERFLPYGLGKVKGVVTYEIRSPPSVRCKDYKRAPHRQTAMEL